MASQSIYQFYAELQVYKPTIWRRFQVPSNVTMARLGYVIMTLFEMQASHLFSIDVPVEANIRRRMSRLIVEDEISGEPDESDPELAANKNWHFEIVEEEDDDVFIHEGERLMDPTETGLKEAVSGAGDELSFSYDFGDGWEVFLRLEKRYRDPALPGSELPRVLEGEGYGIIEDCGGPGGLEELVKVFKKKRGTQYQELREWLGRDSLDMDSFDISDMNFRLKKIPRIYMEIYEKELTPTKQSLSLLERRYLEK